MTSQEKRDTIRRIGFPMWKWFSTDIGAQRCMELVESGTDAQIDDAWNRFYKDGLENLQRLQKQNS